MMKVLLIVPALLCLTGCPGSESGVDPCLRAEIYNACMSMRPQSTSFEVWQKTSDKCNEIAVSGALRKRTQIPNECEM